MKRRQALQLIGGGLVGGTLASSTAAAESSAEFLLPYDPTIEQSPEESRVDFEWPQRILEVSGYDEYEPAFGKALRNARRNRNAARRAVERHARKLWDESRRRAQGKGKSTALHRYDDRPIYWARLEMSRTLRQYEPNFGLSAAEHAEWLRTFDRLSRGYDSTNLPNGATAVKVSGFDPFSHIFTDGPSIADRDNNPSGAAMLAMDGRTFETEEGPVVVDTVMLPVGWLRFNDGILEDAFGPRIANGEVDMIMTVSRGWPRYQKIEGWAAAFRGGGLGTNLTRPVEYIPEADGWPQAGPEDVDDPVAPNSPVLEWIQTTLPFREMMATDEGFDQDRPPWPVAFDTSGMGWVPDGGSDPRFEHDRDRMEEFGVWHNTLPDDFEPERPPDGMLAYSGPGGNYLSNESQYRSNRLRIGLGEHEMGGGHLHCSNAAFGSEDAVTDPQFERELEGTVDQIVDLLLTATNAAT